MAIGFVLITTMPGEEERVRNALDDIEHVTDRWMLFGEFDLLARVQADDEFTLTHDALSKRYDHLRAFKIRRP